MIKAKTPASDLEKKRGHYLQIGLIISCSLTLCAFAWSSFEYESRNFSDVPDVEVEEVILEAVPFLIEKQKKPASNLPKKSSAKKSSHFKLTNVDLTSFENQRHKDDFDPSELWEDFGDHGDDGDFPPEPQIDLRGNGSSSDWRGVQRTPYFIDCENLEDKESESFCSYSKIRALVSKNTSYPERCREEGVEGTVWVKFTINKSGEVQDAHVLKSPHDLLSKAALESVSDLPKMRPGTQLNKPVDVHLQIPVKFILKKN